MINSEALQTILDDDSFKEAMSEIIKVHTNALINSDVNDKESREICYFRITTVNEIMAHLESLASDEKIKNKKWKI